MKTFKEFLELNEKAKDGQYVIIENPKKKGNFSDDYVIEMIAGPLNSWDEVSEYKDKHNLEFGLNSGHNVLIISKGKLFTVAYDTKGPAKPVSQNYGEQNFKAIMTKLGL